ncbi:uncharacterized protein LOC125949266 [Anopheles darlingi]|uniref:uncharacterized protein LOC125949266 n=1 Tax=Anopheles darlingi TaxID=43151 RepID=UPI00210019D9|nr:uncharacterized protein LOC125949266 [Anopheles darlingi]
MFVMLSVRTTTTVRERHAETVQKAININQLIRNINNRKHRNLIRTSQTQQQQQQPPQEIGTTTIGSLVRRGRTNRSRSDSKASIKEDLNNAKQITNSPYHNSSSSRNNSISSSSNNAETPELGTKSINIHRNSNSVPKVTEKVEKTVPLIGTVRVLPAGATSNEKVRLVTGTTAGAAAPSIEQQQQQQLQQRDDSDICRQLSVQLAKPQTATATAVKVDTELVLTATIRPTIKPLKAERIFATTTITTPTPTTTTLTPTALTAVTTRSIAPPEQQHNNSASSQQLNANHHTDANDNGKTKFLLPELNNFRKPPTVQVPVATILNDLSPVPAPVKVTNKLTNSNPMSPMTPAGLQSNSPDVKAMRYYRLWIYTCNAVLLMAVIVFCGVAGKILLSDYKRLLVNGLSLTQPSFIYAYLALLVQSGFLQLIGCLGALRLSEKLLNAYWLLLLVLLIGDAMLGIFWMFKFDKIMHDLQPMLRYRLAHEYGNSPELTELWDRLQNEGRCCGVTGPQDFALNANRTYPTSCCTSDITEQISIGRRPLASAIVFRGDDPTAAVAAATELAASTLKDTLLMSRNFSDISDTWSLITAPSSSSSTSGVSSFDSTIPGQQSASIVDSVGSGSASSDSSSSSSSSSSDSSSNGGRSNSVSSNGDSSSSGSSSVKHGYGNGFSSATGGSSTVGTGLANGGSSFASSGEMEEVKTIVTCRAVYPQGCADRIVSWLRHTADILFVLGYCVIAFLKLCFLGILRYEIKEMIQKIKLLQTEMSGAILNGVDCDQQQIQQFTLLQQVTSTSINGGIHAEPKVGNRDRERTHAGSAESERESLLTQENTPRQLLKHKQLYTCINEQQPQHICHGAGGSGLAGSSSGGTAAGAAAAASGSGGCGGCESDTNSNCALLVEDTNMASLLSTGTATGTTKTINGNNNYELCEFDAKVPSYRLLNAPTVTRI